MGQALAAFQALKWHIDAGADESIGDIPIDRTAVAETLLSSTPKPAEPPPSTEQDNMPLGAFEAGQSAMEVAAAAQTLDELRTAMENFDGCALKRTATNTVFGVGLENAPVMLVGEAPGADEDRLGEPFVGVSGKLLDKMLASINLSREENAYITNIINWRPPGNRNPSPSEIAVCQPFLHRHIELVDPKILLFVGGVSAKTLLETTEGITKLRGRWFNYTIPGSEKTIPAMAMFHPAYLLRNPAHKALAWADLLEVKKRITTDKNK